MKLKIRAAVLIVIALSLFATACSGKKMAKITTTTPVTAPPNVGPPAPLTGQHQPNAELRTRPAIMLKIDNSPAGRPQSNIDKADVIFEERVEGGLSRFIAVFQTYDANPVGPIRSVRSSDPPIVDPLHGLFGYSGGIGAFVNALHQSSAVDVGINQLQSAYKRISLFGHRDEHTLYADLGAIRSSSQAAKGQTPPSFFSFLDDNEVFAAAGAVASSGVTVHMGQTNGDFAWDPTKKLWMRSTDGQPHMVGSDNATTVQLGVNNVIVEYVPYKNTGQKDPARNPVDQAVTVGSGTGFALVDGKKVDIHWVKQDNGAVTSYLDSANAPLKLTQGKTWVMFPPNGATVDIRP